MADDQALTQAVAWSAGVPVEVARWMLEHSSKAVLDLAARGGLSEAEVVAALRDAASAPLPSLPAMVAPSPMASPPWVDAEFEDSAEASDDEAGGTFFGPHGSGGGKND